MPEVVSVEVGVALYSCDLCLAVVLSLGFEGYFNLSFINCVLI